MPRHHVEETFMCSLFGGRHVVIAGCEWGPLGVRIRALWSAKPFAGRGL
ncbi:hypothetical protein FF011L_01980 [Roseimaritima multifibrata]|uniref:Uncharacterized protein n=1 Tax=Roseimaritima multifibrata TaxID=1930274 RepID=A0A517M997_9BACT|nr:hypothetical protein FF011L_01980 [Roseimaritima multifibrata]